MDPALTTIAPKRLPPVSVVTVSVDGYLFIRLLVEKVRAFIGERAYEIVVVDRGSRDGSRDWLRRQPDVRLLTHRQRWWHKGHRHGEAAEYGVRAARHERIVLLDSDAHPIDPSWLHGTSDQLDQRRRLAGARFGGLHRGNPHGWYIHPHFMSFFKSDLDDLIVLRKLRGEDTDTGEEATIRVLDRGHLTVDHVIEPSRTFAVGHPGYPTIAGGVFHAWYTSRLMRNEQEVIRETAGLVSRAAYLDPLIAKLRATYGLDY